MTRSRLISNLLFLFVLFVPGCRSTPQSLTDRERDGLAGPVKAVLTEDIILADQNGQLFETQQASSTAIYDEQGKRTALTPFIILMPTGHAVAQHDPLFEPGGKRTTTEQKNNETITSRFDGKGNLIERIRSDSTGRVIRSIVVNYEFDELENWTKRTITENVETQTKQPMEVTYRRIIYFNNSANATGQNQPVMIPTAARELKNPLTDDERTANLGQALFLQKCATCHGKDGKAQTEFASVMPAKPADLTGDKVRLLSEGELYTVIREGIKPSGMPSMRGRISEESMWRIARYVGRLAAGQATESQVATALSSNPPQPSKPGAVRRYPFKGRIISIEMDYKQATIEHEDIPGYMEAMTMPFPIKDQKTLNKLKKDDHIQATLVVDDKGWRLENVVVK